MSVEHISQCMGFSVSLTSVEELIHYWIIVFQSGPGFDSAAVYGCPLDDRRRVDWRVGGWVH